MRCIDNTKKKKDHMYIVVEQLWLHVNTYKLCWRVWQCPEHAQSLPVSPVAYLQQTFARGQRLPCAATLRVNVSTCTLAA